ncbi:MAG: glycosyltransferase family 2 protein [Clostridia bacterium]|nr:glycosyltransferase family 2 protein [Clostridia bacterium]
MKKLSVIVPCYNEAEVLPAFYDEITKVLDSLYGYSVELLFVNDGSRDETQNIIESFATRDERVKYISFSRNFGKEAAMLAGLENCTGDYAGFIDADLQHSPDLIPEMLKAVDEDGYDIAACRRVDREGEAKLKSFLSDGFYKIVNSITDTHIDDGAQDYRIMNRNVIDSILSIKENVRFTKGIFSWVGFNTKWFPHHNRERAAGETKWSLVKLLKYAIDGIIGYTSTPLRFPLYTGILSLIAGFVYTVVLIITAIVSGGSLALGVAAVIDAVVIVGGLILLSIGIAGEYLSRIYTEVKGRPKYLVAKTNCKK